MEGIDPSSFKPRREALGWSRNRLAVRSGVNPRTVKNVEDGLHSPTRPTLKVMDQALREGEAYMEETSQVSDHIVIELYSGSTWEDWLVVYSNGSVKYHGESTGVRFLRKGAEALDEHMTAAKAKERWPSHAEKIEQALTKLMTDRRTLR